MMVVTAAAAAHLEGEVEGAADCGGVKDNPRGGGGAMKANVRP